LKSKTRKRSDEKKEEEEEEYFSYDIHLNERDLLLIGADFSRTLSCFTNPVLLKKKV
jgi:hypothetical protein